jgi:very-short-patch-repair endonuclease
MTRFDRTPEKTHRARSLRANATKAERKLWRRLKSKQIEGLKFRKQHPIGPYILDFYCPEVKLCIEVDGGQLMKVRTFNLMQRERTFSKRTA